MNKRLQFKCEVKALPDQDDDMFRFSGFASTFSKDLVNDVIEKGAFASAVNSFDSLPILFSHDMEMPVGVTESLQETDKGLFITAALPKTDSFVSGRLKPQIEVGSIKSMSVGFSMSRDDWEMKGNVRHIKNLNLHEISLVVQPAQPEAQITAFKTTTEDATEEDKPKFYTVQEIKDMSPRELEQILKDCGIFSNNAAKCLANFGRNQCEAESNSEEIEQCEAVQADETKLETKLDAILDVFKHKKLLDALDSINI